jgi:excinuclease ABC subunit A
MPDSSSSNWRKPQVDRIEGLSPAIAIEQRRSTSGSRSTIATATEIFDYLRILFAAAGQAYHPDTGRPLQKMTTDEIADRILSEATGRRFMILAPLIKSKTGRHTELLDRLKKNGYVRARIDGKVVLLEQAPALEAGQAHDIEVVIDRLKVDQGTRKRLIDSLELALRLGQHLVYVFWPAEGSCEEECWKMSNRNYDPESDTHFPDWKPRDFSFNHPRGACPRCQGLGTILRADPDLVVPDPDLTLDEMVIAPWKRGNKGIAAQYKSLARDLARHADVAMDLPWSEFPAAARDLFLRGSGGKKVERTLLRRGEIQTRSEPFEGVLAMVESLHQKAKSPLTRRRMQAFMNKLECPDCQGARLRREILAIRLSSSATDPGKNIHQLCQLPIRDALNWIRDLQLTGPEPLLDLHRELIERIQFLDNVGLGYLSLDRETGSLSGGEFQRIRLANQIGSALTGILYVLDEPSIGLHQSDQQRLIDSLLSLRDQGNTVIVVEHDEDTMRQADWIIDLGPGAGPMGGRLMAEGHPDDIMENDKSVTGQYLSGRESVRSSTRRIRPGAGAITVRGASEHNLQSVDVAFPLGCLVCVTGVSGSGKSTLVNRILGRAIFRQLYRAKDLPGKHDRIEGLENIDRAVIVNQQPIGRTPRSNPATYTGLFDEIRTLFASVPASRVRGYTKSRFSFNTTGGRCEKCQGDGQLKIEMNFMPDAYVVCEACQGKRYNRETLDITYRDHTIAEVLDLTIDEARDLFANHAGLCEKLGTLQRVGLGYIKLGQSANTLSGGEAQRIKLATELARVRPVHTLFLLDEPTTGLHFEDISKLLGLLFELRDGGNSLIIIEHHLDVIRSADHIIDLGPGGGTEGGKIVATGSPEEIAAHPASLTGKFLASKLNCAQTERLINEEPRRELF